MRVWIVSELYYPEETSTGYLLTHIAQEIGRQYDAAVLTVRPTYTARGIEVPKRERVAGVDVIRCWSTRFHKDHVFGRLVNTATMTASFFVNALVRFRRGDVALFVTNPPTVPFAIFAASWLRGAVPLLLIHDLYPHVLVATGMIRRGSLTERLMLRLNRALFRRAARVIAIGRDMARLVAAAADGTTEPVIIPNWGAIESILPAPRDANPILVELGIQDKFVLHYAGNMGRTHNLEVLVEAAAALRDRSDIHFLFSGSGAKRAWVERAAAGAPNVTMLAAHYPRAHQHDVLNACDISLISFMPGMSGVSVPSRMYDVLASGHPLLALANDDSELAMMIAEERVGWTVPPGDRDALIERILYAAAHPEELSEMGRRARAAAERKYSLAHIGQSYRDLIASVVAEPHG